MSDNVLDKKHERYQHSRCQSNYRYCDNFERKCGMERVKYE